MDRMGFRIDQVFNSCDEVIVFLLFSLSCSSCYPEKNKEFGVF